VAPSFSRAVAALLASLLLAACVVRSVNQPAGACVEHPLCGEWAGAWDGEGSKGEAYLTVRRVSGRQVEGLVLLRGRFPEAGKDLPFTGTFEDNDLLGTLRAGPGRPPMSWRLTLDAAATELKGRGFDGVWSDLHLTKRR
jgi:hypothetical protein